MTYSSVNSVRSIIVLRQTVSTIQLHFVFPTRGRQVPRQASYSAVAARVNQVNSASRRAVIR